MTFVFEKDKPSQRQKANSSIINKKPQNKLNRVAKLGLGSKGLIIKEMTTKYNWKNIFGCVSPEGPLPWAESQAGQPTLATAPHPAWLLDALPAGTFNPISIPPPKLTLPALPGSCTDHSPRVHFYAEHLQQQHFQWVLKQVSVSSTIYTVHEKTTSIISKHPGGLLLQCLLQNRPESHIQIISQQCTEMPKPFFQGTAWKAKSGKSLQQEVQGHGKEIPL